MKVLSYFLFYIFMPIIQKPGESRLLISAGVPSLKYQIALLGYIRPGNIRTSVEGVGKLEKIFPLFLGVFSAAKKNGK